MTLTTGPEYDHARKIREAIQQVPCPRPRCTAGKGERCRTPSGGNVQVPHFERREKAIAEGVIEP